MQYTPYITYFLFTNFLSLYPKKAERKICLPFLYLWYNARLILDKNMNSKFIFEEFLLPTIMKELVPYYLSHYKQLQNWAMYLKQLFWTVGNKQYITVIPDRKETHRVNPGYTNSLSGDNVLTEAQRARGHVAYNGHNELRWQR